MLRVLKDICFAFSAVLVALSDPVYFCGGEG